jgi:hypothetical protein
VSERIARRLRRQAAACEQLGSYLYAELIGHAAEDVERGGPVGALLAGHEDDQRGSALALRLMAAVHRLVLAGQLPKLAAHYPSAGGDGDAAAAWPALLAAADSHHDELRALIPRGLQTNEVGRSAALAPAFVTVAERTRLPLRLLEIGAAAGLNLRFDRYRYEGGFGDPASPVRFDGMYERGEPPLGGHLEVASRAGCDANPLDPGSDDDRLTLRSCIWADQVERLRLLEAALGLARALPVEIERADAVEWLAGQLAKPAAGVATVVYHSVVWQYLGDDRRRALRALIEEAGAGATARAPLGWLAMEPPANPDEQPMAEVRLRLWPGGDDELIALTGYHGRPVHWLA